MINIVQGLTLVGLGMLVESKEKRQKVFGLMNKLGKTAEKTVKEITKSGGSNVSATVEEAPTEYK